jgi:hypothetical protein
VILNPFRKDINMFKIIKKGTMFLIDKTQLPEALKIKHIDYIYKSFAETKNLNGLKSIV